MKQALVLDANQRSALAVTRSLGMRGITVFTADERPSALAGFSRFSAGYLTYSSPFSREQEFITSIARILREHDIKIVYPMTELTTTLLLRNRHALPEASLTFPDIATVDSLTDKCSLMRMADSLAVPVPKTWYANRPNDIISSLSDLPYPIVLKPGKSWLHSSDQWIHTTVRYAKSASDAADILESEPAFHLHPFMIQECISGCGMGIFALYDQGKPLAFFSHQRIREKPPRGGVSVLSESIPVNPSLLAHARSLLDKANWHGIAMVEFKVTEDGTPYLMEINTRFWGSLQLAVDAGVDFPWLLHQMACGELVNPLPNYDAGGRLRWVLGDLDSLYLLLRSSGYSPGEKILAILKFMRPDPFRTRHEVNRLGDLGPAWFELKEYLRDLFRLG